jgi:hypothetical protein
VPLELRFLPAAEGDAIWVRWGDDLQHQLLVDMGKETTGTVMRRRFEALPNRERSFELLVITHVDGDHIGGVLTGLAEAPGLDGLAFEDVWFNGWAHLHGKAVPAPGHVSGLESMGAAQGQRLTAWLTGPWNEAFGRGPVARASPLKTVELSDDLTLTVLGPTTERLTDLIETWEDEVELAIAKGRLPASAGLEAMGRAKPVKPELETPIDLGFLADEASKLDGSRSNGTSITLLLEWRHRRVLLTGDAFGADVVDGLRLVGGDGPVALDLVKLPHHGSQANVSDALVKAIASPAWVISTNGAVFHHPDAAAVARVIRGAIDPRPTLYFNVPSEFNEWWTDETWTKRFDYATETGTADEGLTITLQPG